MSAVTELLNTLTTTLPQFDGAASCAATGHPDLWHDAGTEQERQQAINICDRCPLLDDCRQWALNNPHLTEHGIWGGLTPYQRTLARNKQTAA